MLKYVFFDLDNTLSRSRTPVTPSMSKLLRSLARHHEVLVVSGAEKKQIAYQLTPALDGAYWVMGQNGNACVDRTGKVLWEKKLSWLQKLEVLSYINKVVAKKFFTFKDIYDLVQDRGSQISYSLIGHTEDISKKERFDPDHKKRQLVLKKVPYSSKTMEVKIGGTTTLDFFARGSNKGKNISDLCTLLGWKKNECLYVGDALFKNGNDETVIGVIPTRQVSDPEDTERVIKEVLAMR